MDASHLDAKITEQGNKVRELKASKAPKVSVSNTYLVCFIPSIMLNLCLRGVDTLAREVFLFFVCFFFVLFFFSHFNRGLLLRERISSMRAFFLFRVDLYPEGFGVQKE